MSFLENSLFFIIVSLRDLGTISYYPNPLSAGIYVLQVNNRNTRTRCDICSKFTIKTPDTNDKHCPESLILTLSVFLMKQAYKLFVKYKVRAKTNLI